MYMKAVRFDDCPACGTSSTTTAFAPDEESWEMLRVLSRRKYQGYMDTWRESLNLEVRQCLKCGHFWHHTQPDFSSLLGMYQASVPLHKNLKDPAREPSAAMLKIMGSLYRLATQNSDEPLTFLDYGSGRGRWARAAASVGFRVWAYEPSVKRAKEGAGDILIVNNLEELAGIQFDVVNLEQVLEHTQEPIKVLHGLFPYMKPHSLVRVTVPNVSRAQGKNLWSGFPFDGHRIHIMSPYEHLHGFTLTSLQILLQRAGLEPERSFAAWQTHPVHLMRAMVGKWLPWLATTYALVHPVQISASANR